MSVLSRFICLMISGCCFFGCDLFSSKSKKESSNNDYFSIISPTKETVVKLDSIIEIKWISSENVTATEVKIELFLGNQKVWDIATRTENDSSFDWDVGPHIGSGSNYRIQISNFYDSTQSSLSAPILITSTFNGSIIVTWPPDGIVITDSSHQEIIWKISGNPGSDVRINLMRDTAILLNISGITPNDGTFDWFVPAGIESSNDYKIVITSFQDGSLSDTSGIFDLNGVVSDSFENDNSKLEASPIQLNESQTHTLNLSDKDWVKFEADSGKVYLIIHPGIETYKNIDINDSVFGLTNMISPIKTKMVAPTTGTYYLGIFNKDSYYGEYSITIKEVDMIISPSFGDTLFAGEEFNVLWDTTAVNLGQDLSINFFYESLDLPRYSYSVSNTGSHKIILPTTFKSDNYQLIIQNTIDSNVFHLSEMFYLKCIDPDIFENDNQIEFAKNITIDGIVQDHTFPFADEDWIKFYSNKNRVYSVNISGSADIKSDIYFNSVDNGKIISSKENLYIIEAKEQGDYYVRVSNDSLIYPAYGNYSISVELIDSMKLAKLNVSQPSSNTVWDEGQVYDIVWTPDSTILGIGVSIELMKGEKFITVLNSAANDGITNVLYGVRGFLTGSDYSIKIVNSQNPNLFAESATFTINGINSDLYENDDNSDSAILVVSGGILNYRTMTFEDQDWMKFSKPGGKDYFVYVTESPWLKMELFKESDTSNPLKSTEIVNPYIVLSKNDSGHYLVKLSPKEYGSYHFSLIEFDPDTIVEFIQPGPLSVWAKDTQYTVEWTFKEVYNGSSFPGQISLYLYKADTLIRNIGGINVKSKQKRWTIKSDVLPGSDYYLQMISNNFTKNSPVFSIN